MLPTVLFDLRVALVFALMLIVLVFAHEYGHYIFARLFGMGVEEFSIGFGRPRLGTYYRRRYRIPVTQDQAEAWTRGEFEIPLPDDFPNALKPELVKPADVVYDASGPYLDEATRFTVRAWPIGGFVRIRGMTSEEEGKETQIPGGFYSKPPWQRLVVLFAGPMFSVLAGMLILIPYGMVVGKQAFSHNPVLVEVQKDGPGFKGGLREGDRIVSVNGQPISDFYQVVLQVRSNAEKPLAFTVDRAGNRVALAVTPVMDDKPSQVLGPDLLPTGEMKRQGKLQVRPAFASIPVGFLTSAEDAISVPILTVAGLAEGVMHPSTLKDQVGGPVSIVRATAEATHQGIAQVFFMAGVLSVSLGIFNLLPFFPMDGGQMIISFAELLRRGKRLSMRAQNAVATMGISAMFLLVIGVLFIDFQRLHSSPPNKPTTTSTAK